MGKFKERNRGITLIALVITIIVLLILAGVSIAMLTGENGILTQAQKAKTETENAQSREEITLGQYESYINKTTGTSAVVGEIVTGGNKPYTNNGTAIIPEGFMIVPGLDNIEEGLVISDNANDTEISGQETIAEGNQFVWVPVTNFTEFKREHFGTEAQKWWTGDFVTDKISENNLYEASADEIKHETEVEQMYKSVKDNGGFYIGRYEAGTETERNEESTIEDDVVSKKDKFVYNYIGWNNDGTMTTETGGAVEKARSFSTEANYTNVTSTLVYGVQWDAIMRWLSNGTAEEQEWLIDSTGKGNYSNKDSNSTSGLSKTGAIDAYQIKHIYDLAGNVLEWTMEAYSTSYRIHRGGYYGDYATSLPCSGRGGYNPNRCYPQIGFRLALYIK